MARRYSRRARALEDSDRFLPEQISRLRGWSEEKCPKLGPGEFEEELELCLEFHRARGTLIRDLEASAREWLLRGERRRKWPKGARGTTHTQAPRDRRTEEHIRSGDTVAEQVAREDPEERRRLVEEARKRPWRGKSQVIKHSSLTDD
jgi:hypothetical protein